MSNFVVDVESDGPLQGTNNLISFAIIKLTPELNTYYTDIVTPITNNSIPQARAVSNISMPEQIEAGRHPLYVFKELDSWVNKVNEGHRPTLWSDNPAYDFPWINYYSIAFTGSNPFGYSARRIGDLISGLKQDARYSWKKHRKTKHSHDPLDDARGNAEVLLWANSEYNLKLL